MKIKNTTLNFKELATFPIPAPSNEIRLPDQSDGIIQENPFEELHLFRQFIEEGRSALHQFPYTTNKGKIIFYKFIFLIITLIFTAFTGYIYCSPSTLCYSFLFGNHDTIKLLSCCFTATMAAVALRLALRHTPEWEIAHSIITMSKKRGRKTYNRRLLHTRRGDYSLRNDISYIRSKIRHEYSDFADRIDVISDETDKLLTRIRISKVLKDSDKECLYNQGLLELQQKLHFIVKDYEQLDSI